jgi:hypothetical protein
MIYHLKLQPSEIEALDYYEFHYFVKDLADVLKKKQESEGTANEQAQKQQPGYKMPNVKMPNVKMPSMPKL